MLLDSGSLCNKVNWISPVAIASSYDLSVGLPTRNRTALTLSPSVSGDASALADVVNVRRSANERPFDPPDRGDADGGHSGSSSSIGDETNGERLREHG